MNKISRPKADPRKIGHRNFFELCYLRHKYLRRCEYNPSAEEMAPYSFIVKHFAGNTFYTYRDLFRTVGFEYDDLESIGNIHLVSFLCLFSLEHQKAKFESFRDTFIRKNDRVPNDTDILNKNKASFTQFLKQRFEDLIRICRQKARNIKGCHVEAYQVFYGPKRPAGVNRDLIQNYEKLGYRKLDLAAFRSIRKHAKDQDKTCFQFDGNWYVCVANEQKNLELVDFSGAGLDPCDNIHNMNPEQVFFSTSEQEYWDNKKQEFGGLPVSVKARKLQHFITKNKSNRKMREEIRAARQMLKEMENG